MPVEHWIGVRWRMLEDRCSLEDVGLPSHVRPVFVEHSIGVCWMMSDCHRMFDECSLNMI